MLQYNNLKKKESKMDTVYISVSILVLTLFNLGLVTLALIRLNGLRKDLRTPVVKKFNADFKKKSVDIPRTPENFGKTQREDKPYGRTNNQALAQNRQKGNSQQNRPSARRPASKTLDVFSNEPVPQAPAPVPPRPVAAEPTQEGGRRPLPPRFNDAANHVAPVSIGSADLAPPASANHLANDSSEEAGMEFDRTKIAHGRRNVVAKPVIEDDGAEA